MFIRHTSEISLQHRIRIIVSIKVEKCEILHSDANDVKCIAALNICYTGFHFLDKVHENDCG